MSYGIGFLFEIKTTLNSFCLIFSYGDNDYIDFLLTKIDKKFIDDCMRNIFSLVEVRVLQKLKKYGLSYGDLFEYLSIKIYKCRH